jgi:hypothetical protein
LKYEEYKRNYIRNPEEQEFGFESLNSVTLFYEDFHAAINYYTDVLGKPNYQEGEFTFGWRIGTGWLTILKGKSGNPSNVEIAFIMKSYEEANLLQQAFIEAGGTGQEPVDTLMYDPVHICPVTDPFGVEIMVYAKVDKK